MGYRKGQAPVDTLLDELCVDLGFCLPPEDKARIQHMAIDEVDAFTTAVFMAEGLLEPYDRRLWSAVRDRVVRHVARFS
jgi:hypothetical protein